MRAWGLAVRMSLLVTWWLMPCIIIINPLITITAGGITCLDPSLHSEVELLLENYHRQLVLIGAQINILRQRVRTCVHLNVGFEREDQCPYVTPSTHPSTHPSNTHAPTPVLMTGAIRTRGLRHQRRPPPQPRPPHHPAPHHALRVIRLCRHGRELPRCIYMMEWLGSPLIAFFCTAWHEQQAHPHSKSRHECDERDGTQPRGVSVPGGRLLLPRRRPLLHLLLARPVRWLGRMHSWGMHRAVLPFWFMLTHTCVGHSLLTSKRCRDQGKDRMRQDLNSVQAYNNIFKHIRSISQVRSLDVCFSTLLATCSQPACRPPAE